MLVVDANILIRAVLGVRVRSLIVKYGAVVDLFAPDTAWAEAREHLPLILRKRGIPVEAGVLLLNSLEEIIQPVEFETYGSFEPAARRRTAHRCTLPRSGLSLERGRGAPILRVADDSPAESSSTQAVGASVLR